MIKLETSALRGREAEAKNPRTFWPFGISIGSNALNLMPF